MFVAAAVGLVAIAVVLVVAPVSRSSVRAVSTSPPKTVVGSGTINVPTLSSVSSPRNARASIARLSEFRPQDYRPRYVLAVGAKKEQEGENLLVQDHRPGPPERPHRLGAGEAGLDQVGAVAGRRLSRFARAPIVEDGTSSSTRQGRGRSARDGDADRPLLRHRSLPVRCRSRSSGASRSRRAPTPSSRNGRAAALSGSTARPRRSLLGQAVSHGCVRISNETANFLRDRIPLGTPIRILAS